MRSGYFEFPAIIEREPVIIKRQPNAINKGEPAKPIKLVILGETTTPTIIRIPIMNKIKPIVQIIPPRTLITFQPKSSPIVISSSDILIIYSSN